MARLGQHALAETGTCSWRAWRRPAARYRSRPRPPVSSHPAIDDTPSLAADPVDGTVWVGWNSMRGHARDALRTDRHAGDAFVRAFRGGRWLAPASPHAGGLPGQVSFGAVVKTPHDAVDPYWHWKQTQNYPVVALDAARRLWVVWRTDATGAHNFDLWGRVYDGQGWSEELHLTTPYGGRDEWPALALAPAGDLWLAWEGQPDPSGSGGPPLGRGDVDVFNTLAAPNAVFLGRLSAPAAATPAPLAEAPAEADHADAPPLARVPGPPAGGVATDDGAYRIYFGDPHSHSVLSDAKTGHADQVLALARDRFGLDYAVVSDHSEMGRLQHGEYAEIRALARAFTRARPLPQLQRVRVDRGLALRPPGRALQAGRDAPARLLVARGRHPRGALRPGAEDTTA